MKKSIVISLNYFLVFVGFNCNGFSLKWWWFDQENWRSHEKHMPESVSWLISRLGQLTRWTVRCTDSWNFRCDSYPLDSYYIYHHYLQNCKEAIQIVNPREVSITPTILERATHSLSENSFVVSSPFPFPLPYLERWFVPKHNSHSFRV